MILTCFGILLAVLLGPETPISAPKLDAAAGEQTLPAIAWYGDSLVATWIDNRGLPTVRVAHLDGLGKPKEVAARLAGGIFDIRLASNGAATPLIATSFYGDAYIGPVGRSGRQVGGSLGDLVTNGSTYLLLTLETKTLHVSILDADGESLAEARLPSSGSATVVPMGGAYHVIHVQDDCGVGCSRALHDTIVSEDGTASDQVLTAHVGDGTRVAAAAAGDRLLIAWTNGTRIELLTLTSAGAFIAHTSIDVRPGELFAGSDGNGFLVGWTDSEALRLVRVNDSGSVEGEPFTLGTWRIDRVSFARTPDGVVLAWSDGANVFTRGAASFDQIADAPDVLASIGYVQQQQISLKNMPVWVEGETSSRIQSAGATIETAQPGHLLLHPVAARGAGATLVAWIDSTDTTATIKARFNADPPIAIGTAGLFTPDVDVVFDGAGFFVVWTNHQLYKTRISTSGVRLETTEIESTGDVTSVCAGRVGEKVAVVFTDGQSIEYDGESRRTIGSVSTFFTRPRFAVDDRGQPFVVWSDVVQGKNCVVAAHRIDDALFAVQPLACGANAALSVSVAWSGTEFVVAWDEMLRNSYRGIELIRASRSGEPLDATPTVISQNFRDTFGPNLVSSPEGVTIGYQRIAGEEPFDDVSRVFTRTLARLGGVPRLRPAR